MTESIQALLRVRPLIKSEQNFAWNVEENSILLLPSFAQAGLEPFGFTKIFDEISTNSDVFDESIRPLVSQLLDGRNCTVLAYGQSSAGKTSTMFNGPNSQPGIVQLVAEQLFQLTSASKHRVKAQFIELYNEQIRDLLSTKLPTLREENGVIVLQGAEEQVVANLQQLEDLIALGQKARTQSETALNEQSSRSHALLRLLLESGDQPNLPTKKGPIRSRSAFTLVDLAGSEKLQKSNAQGAQLREGNAINQSLLTLGLVVSQLATQQKFVNYRDSKLTRMLQNSLGGSAHCVIIGCVAPAAAHIEESISTMRFCSRAMKVQNKIEKMVEKPEQLQKEQLMIQNRSLKLRVQELEKQMNVSTSQMHSSNMSDEPLDLAEISMMLEEGETKACVFVQTEFDNEEELKREIQRLQNVLIENMVALKQIDEVKDEAQLQKLMITELEAEIAQKEVELNIALETKEKNMREVEHMKQKNQHHDELVKQMQLAHEQAQLQLELEKQQQLDGLLMQLDMAEAKPEMQSFNVQKSMSKDEKNTSAIGWQDGTNQTQLKMNVSASLQTSQAPNAEMQTSQLQNADGATGTSTNFAAQQTSQISYLEAGTNKSAVVATEAGTNISRGAHDMQTSLVAGKSITTSISINAKDQQTSHISIVDKPVGVSACADFQQTSGVVATSLAQQTSNIYQDRAISVLMRSNKSNIAQTSPNPQQTVQTSAVITKSFGQNFAKSAVNHQVQASVVKSTFEQQFDQALVDEELQTSQLVPTRMIQKSNLTSPAAVRSRSNTSDDEADIVTQQLQSKSFSDPPTVKQSPLKIVKFAENSEGDDDVTKDFNLAQLQATQIMKLRTTPTKLKLMFSQPDPVDNEVQANLDVDNNMQTSRQPRFLQSAGVQKTVQKDVKIQQVQPETRDYATSFHVPTASFQGQKSVSLFDRSVIRSTVATNEQNLQTSDADADKSVNVSRRSDFLTSQNAQTSINVLDKSVLERSQQYTQNFAQTSVYQQDQEVDFRTQVQSQCANTSAYQAEKATSQCMSPGRSQYLQTSRCNNDRDTSFQCQLTTNKSQLTSFAAADAQAQYSHTSMLSGNAQTSVYQRDDECSVLRIDQHSICAQTSMDNPSFTQQCDEFEASDAYTQTDTCEQCTNTECGYFETSAVQQQKLKDFDQLLSDFIKLQQDNDQLQQQLRASEEQLNIERKQNEDQYQQFDSEIATLRQQLSDQREHIIQSAPKFESAELQNISLKEQLLQMTNELEAEHTCHEMQTSAVIELEKTVHIGFDISSSQLQQNQQNADLQKVIDQQNAKFQRLLESSKQTIAKLVSTAKERELNLQKKVAEEVKALQKYKDIVMKMQAQQAMKLAAQNAGLRKEPAKE